MFDLQEFSVNFWISIQNRSKLYEWVENWGFSHIAFSIVHGKIMLQDIWAIRTEWDQQILENISGQWPVVRFFLFEHRRYYTRLLEAKAAIESMTSIYVPQVYVKKEALTPNHFLLDNSSD